MKRLLFTIGLALVGVSAFAADGDFTYQRFLDTYARPGTVINGYTVTAVDYGAIAAVKDDPASLYRTVLGELSVFDPWTLETREEKIAFWINAYNIGAIKIIVDHYPVDSIRSMRINFLKNPWKKKILTVGGRRYSLGEIEHGILLGKLGEPLAHFGVVCASLSCPTLLPRAYRPETVTEQLGEAARAFLTDPKKGLFINREKGVVRFSRIFKFDKKTFPRGGPSAISLIRPFIGPEDAAYLETGDYTVKYLDYDWSLNALVKPEQ